MSFPYNRTFTAVSLWLAVGTSAAAQQQPVICSEPDALLVKQAVQLALAGDGAGLRDLARRTPRTSVARTLVLLAELEVGLDDAAGWFLKSFPTSRNGARSLYACSLSGPLWLSPFAKLGYLAADGSEPAMVKLLRVMMVSDGHVAEELCEALGDVAARQPRALVEVARADRRLWASFLDHADCVAAEDISELITLLQCGAAPTDTGCNRLLKALSEAPPRASKRCD